MALSHVLNMAGSLGKQTAAGEYTLESNIDQFQAVETAFGNRFTDPEGEAADFLVRPADGTNSVWAIMSCSYSLDAGTHKLSRVYTTESINGAGDANQIDTFSTDSESLEFLGVFDGGKPVVQIDGWTDDVEAWEFVDATSFRILGADFTDKFPVGTKIKCVNSTTKYFYVSAASFATNTTVTVTGGDDYVLVSGDITSPQYSYSATAQGFPHWFNYTPTTMNGITLGNGTLLSKFSVVENILHVEITIDFGTTSAVTTNAYITAPMTPADHSTYKPVGHLAMYDNSGNDVYIGMVGMSGSINMQLWAINSASTYGERAIVNTTVPFTWGNTDKILLTAKLSL